MASIVPFKPSTGLIPGNVKPQQDPPQAPEGWSLGRSLKEAFQRAEAAIDRAIKESDKNFQDMRVHLREGNKETAGAPSLKEAIGSGITRGSNAGISLALAMQDSIGLSGSQEFTASASRTGDLFAGIRWRQGVGAATGITQPSDGQWTRFSSHRQRGQLR